MSHRSKVLAGPLLFILAAAAAAPVFGAKGALSLALAVWMAVWWILRPVEIAVTALLPIAVNAVFGLVPAGQVISQYFSEIVVLLFGADLICATWSTTGLDRRLSIRALSGIGTGMRQQICVWLAASVFLSVFLPNVVVAGIFCPVAAAMVGFAEKDPEQKTALLAPILLAVGWGSGIGGFGSPIGGAANLVAISYIEELTGREFMYIDWVVRFVPLLLAVACLVLLFLLRLPLPVKNLSGTEGYFREMYEKMGPMQKGEKTGLFLFLLATFLAFARPFFAPLLPSLRPAYCFLILGMLMFFLKDEKGSRMLTWKDAAGHAMWGMYFLFASGMALGKIITGTGAVKTLSEMIATSGVSSPLALLLIFTLFGTFMSEISSNTGAASITLPVVIDICRSLSLDPMPYVLMSIVAVNCAYVLPVSTRAIPVAFGLEAPLQMRSGLILTCLNILLTVLLGMLCLNIPSFGAL